MLSLAGISNANSNRSSMPTLDLDGLARQAENDHAWPCSLNSEPYTSVSGHIRQREELERRNGTSERKHGLFLGLETIGLASLGRKMYRSLRGLLGRPAANKIPRKTSGNLDIPEIITTPPKRIFGVELRESIRSANVAISILQYIYGHVPIVIAKIGAFLKEKGKVLDNTACLNSFSQLNRQNWRNITDAMQQRLLKIYAVNVVLQNVYTRLNVSSNRKPRYGK